MRRHCGVDRAARPEAVGRLDCETLKPARLYLCGLCRRQVVICSGCDRGNIYCWDCAPLARRRSLRQAGARYRKSWRGRFTQAVRTRRWRAGKNKVTHHGSPAAPADAVVAEDPAAVATEQARAVVRPRGHCQFCGRRCPDFVRRDFLRRRGPWNQPRGPRRDDSG